MSDFKIRTLALALTLVLSFALQGRAQNTPSLGDEMKLKGQAIAQYLKEVENVQSCGIGTFTGPKQSPASGVGEMLRAELESHGIEIVGSGKAEYFINGRCGIEDDGFGSHEMVIDIEILDDLGSTVKNLPTTVKLSDGNSVPLAVDNKIFVKTDKADDIAKVVLVSTSLTDINEANEPAATKERRKVNKIIKNIRKPSAHLAGTKIQTSSSSPYALELAINGSVTKPKLDGFYYAPMQRNDTCHLKFYNDSDHAVKVEVFVDGINSFNFADNPKDRKIGGYKIPAGKAGTIKGWFQDNQHVEEFKITPHPKSAVARNAASGNKNDASKEGIIAIAVHRWHNPGEQPKLQGKGGGKPDAFGFGKDIFQESKTVQGHKGELQEIISVRYRR